VVVDADVTERDDDRNLDSQITVLLAPCGRCASPSAPPPSACPAIAKRPRFRERNLGTCSAPAGLMVGDMTSTQAAAHLGITARAVIKPIRARAQGAPAKAMLDRASGDGAIAALLRSGATAHVGSTRGTAATDGYDPAAATRSP